MSKTYKILLRMNAVDSKKLDEVKKMYGTKKATVALTKAMYDASKFLNEIDLLEKKIIKLQNENSKATVDISQQFKHLKIIQESFTKTFKMG